MSDASFAALFAVARELGDSRLDVILEGNFRRGEHESPFAALPPAHTVQILCRMDESRRRENLLARAQDPQRHPAHRDAESVTLCNASTDRFLEIVGEQLVHAIAATDAQQGDFLRRLDQCWQGARTGVSG